jgi:hypothetical protein
MIKRDGHEFVETDRAVLRDTAEDFPGGLVRTG